MTPIQVVWSPITESCELSRKSSRQVEALHWSCTICVRERERPMSQIAPHTPTNDISNLLLLLQGTVSKTENSKGLLLQSENSRMVDADKSKPELFGLECPPFTVSTYS